MKKNTRGRHTATVGFNVKAYNDRLTRLNAEGAVQYTTQWISKHILNRSNDYMSGCKRRGTINIKDAEILAKFFKCRVKTLICELPEKMPLTLFEEVKKDTLETNTDESNLTEKLLAEIAHEMHMQTLIMQDLLDKWK